MPIYRLHVRLEDIRPPIWRRFQVRDDVTFHRLHLVLQVMMGWENYHLYEFTLGAVTLIPGAALAEIGPAYGRPADAARLSAHLQTPGETCQYTYDFGDAWRHRITLEAIEEETETTVTPYCLAGARAFPPEDCGGVGGYEHLLAALGDPDHPRHDRYREWLGAPFDPERFDREAINRRLREGVSVEGDLLIPPLTLTNTFTAPARRVWQAIPDYARARLIGGSWCVWCRKKTTIVDFHGRMEGGDLLLEGQCLSCDGPVTRLIEGQ